MHYLSGFLAIALCISSLSVMAEIGEEMKTTLYDGADDSKPDIVPTTSGEMGFVIIIDNSLKYYSDADLSAEIEGSASSDFGRSFTVVDKGKFEGKDWLKIKHPRFEQVWLIDDGNKILEPGSGTQKVEAQKTDQGKLFKKGLVRNHGRQDGNQTSVAYYNSPNLSGPPLGTVSIFEVRYIFKITNKAVLLGRVDRALSTNSRDVLVGWLDKENIIEWNNRIGVEFNKGNWEEREKCGVGKIYFTERSARKRKGHEFEEGRGKDGLPYYANRYPLLETVPRQGTQGIYYKIAYIGNAVADGRIIDKEEIDKARNTLDTVIRQENVDIMILVDATRGMARHIANVKGALKKFMKSRIDNSSRKQAKVGLAVYRDYPDGSGIFEEMQDLTGNIAALNGAVDRISVRSNSADQGIGSFPEAVFYGIDHAIKKADWEGEGLRFLILIGDHGNHEDYSQYPRDKSYTAAGIGKMLRENKVTMLAVHVNRSDGSKTEFIDRFKRQIEVISESNDRSFSNYIPVRENSVDSVLIALRDSMAFDQKYKEHYISVRNNARRETGGLGMYKGHFTAKLLERLGIDPDVFKASQLCEKGFVHEKDKCKNDLMERKVLVERNILEGLKVGMDLLSGTVRDFDNTPESVERFEGVVAKVVRALTGDKIGQDEEIAEFIEKRTGIPVHTDLLERTMGQLIEFSRKPNNRKRFVKYLLERVIRLEQVIREQHMELGNWDSENMEWIYNPSDKKIFYFFSLEQPLPDRGKLEMDYSKRRHAWVPLEYFP
uniref:VWFA domain-containing protein n=1 Tax=Candidatus Kentrum sp. FW TaxID=2126338 RepID=A0A450T0X6_9GAMM|nr:MAG: hypothetical protein BECKFW1821A_GA0114235_10972 [Candidatus Kentron sp. FW]